MKNHVLRPLFLAIAAVALLLIVRNIYVPDDFGVNGRNFTYGFHRKGNIQDWKEFKVKYRGRETCAECHDEYKSITASKHKIIQCENCHGPILGHGDENNPQPAKLPIDKSRELCLRCHAALPYALSKRSQIPGINPEEHNPGEQCSDCHNPHDPNLEDM